MSVSELASHGIMWFAVSELAVPDVGVSVLATRPQAVTIARQKLSQHSLKLISKEQSNGLLGKWLPNGTDHKIFPYASLH